MAIKPRETIAKLVEAFERDHPEYFERLNKEILAGYLEEAYDEVLRGDYVAKTAQQLDRESEACGIKKPEYEAMINLATHAATDRPVEGPASPPLPANERLS